MSIYLFIIQYKEIGSCKISMKITETSNRITVTSCLVRISREVTIGCPAHQKQLALLVMALYTSLQFMFSTGVANSSDVNEQE